MGHADEVNHGEKQELEAEVTEINEFSPYLECIGS